MHTHGLKGERGKERVEDLGVSGEGRSGIGRGGGRGTRIEKRRRELEQG